MGLYITRGNMVSFEASFVDKDRNPALQNAATLHLSFKVEGERTTASVAMTKLLNGTFTATWDSSVADPGIIEWHIRSNGSDKTAEDGSFQLRANNANPST